MLTSLFLGSVPSLLFIWGVVLFIISFIIGGGIYIGMLSVIVGGSLVLLGFLIVSSTPGSLQIGCIVLFLFTMIIVNLPAVMMIMVLLLFWLILNT